MRQRILAVIVLIFAGSSPSQAASLVHIACGYCNARAISADGTVIVGNSLGDAFRWSAATGLVNLGAGFTSLATGVSGDGSIVVGWDPQFDDGDHFFRWTTSTGIQDLGPGQAEDISVDGTTIVGQQLGRAFRWTEATGVVPLTPAFSSGIAFAVSADGSVIAGTATLSPNTYPTAGRWTAATGWVDLGLMPGEPAGPYAVSAATAISATGIVLGGFSRASGAEPAFRLTQGSGMVQLDPSPGNASARNYVRGISADGSIMVGEGNFPFVWTAAGGIQDLRQFLIGRGVTGVEAFSNLGYIGGISPDGRFITGSGSVAASGNLEAWIADLGPVPIPAAAWLLGSALGVLGCVRRRALRS